MDAEASRTDFRRFFPRRQVTLMGVALFASLATQALAQRAKVLLEDQKVLVTEVELSDGEPFFLPHAAYGTVWIARDPMMFAETSNGQHQVRPVPAGHVQSAETDEKAQWSAKPDSRARLLLVTPKTPHQELTIEPFLTGNRTSEDASDRNATLVVAISPIRFRDTQNRGDESQWIPSKPEIITLHSGGLKWISPGIHHFYRVSTQNGNAISIEW